MECEYDFESDRSLIQVNAGIPLNAERSLENLEGINWIPIKWSLTAPFSQQHTHLPLHAVKERMPRTFFTVSPFPLLFFYRTPTRRVFVALRWIWVTVT